MGLDTVELVMEMEETFGKAWHTEEVWFTLRELIAVPLGVAREDVTEESFVHDFGAD